LQGRRELPIFEDPARNQTNMQTTTNQIYTEKLPGGHTLPLIRVAGGAFMMGSEEAKDEQPIHQVTVPDFYLGQYPVTNRAYAVFLNHYGSDEVSGGEYAGQKMVYSYRWGVQVQDGRWAPAKGFEDHPVVVVTWYGAQEYNRWLSEQTGRPYRLPSEAEWEYAARGGNQSLGFRYAGGHKLKEVGWYDKNSHDETKPVGLKLPNELGMYDMSGNVWEWCADFWYENYEGAPEDGGAWLGRKDDRSRVVRGGSWSDFAAFCSVSYRFWDVAVNWSISIGFRVARY
jgi:formylglycine-generating enzyme required for sulfatase activity